MSRRVFAQSKISHLPVKTARISYIHQHQLAGKVASELNSILDVRDRYKLEPSTASITTEPYRKIDNSLVISPQKQIASSRR